MTYTRLNCLQLVKSFCCIFACVLLGGIVAEMLAGKMGTCYPSLHNDEFSVWQGIYSRLIAHLLKIYLLLEFKAVAVTFFP